MISVVVSVYNMEKYLDRCISSLLKQTYKEYEIILVDDGSTDTSSSLCDEWAKKETSIRVFHKPNGGLSSARNFGIDHALGDLITFPDPDDWVEPGYLEKLISIKEHNLADLSICGHFNGEDIWNQNAKPVVLDMRSALFELMLPSSFSGYAWNKLYSMDIIKKNALRFDEELGMVQDLHFNVRYFQYCSTIVYDPEPFYHYIVNDASVTSPKTPLNQRKLSGLVTYKKIGQITHNKLPEIEKISYASLCKLCLDYMIIYYRSGMKDTKVLTLLQSYFRKYKRCFYSCTAYTHLHKSCSRFATIHPYAYFTARRIYWRIYHLKEKLGSHHPVDA